LTSEAKAKDKNTNAMFEDKVNTKDKTSCPQGASRAAKAMASSTPSLLFALFLWAAVKVLIY